MKVVIIEDEPLTAEDLASTLSDVDPLVKVVAQLESVVEAVCYFDEHDLPDLIFSDIQLSDGLSFEIFKKVNISTPVIFCTAYDEYAIQAFKANGIDYIMKPFSKNTVAAALTRFQALKTSFSKSSLPYEAIMDVFNRRESSVQASVLVYYKDQILPIRFQDIALFFIQNEVTHLTTFKGENYFVDHNLDQLDQITDSNFFRANRQALINRRAVKSASRFFGRKLVLSLSIPHKESVVVSKAKVSLFLSWLSGTA